MERVEFVLVLGVLAEDGFLLGTLFSNFGIHGAQLLFKLKAVILQKRALGIQLRKLLLALGKLCPIFLLRCLKDRDLPSAFLDLALLCGDTLTVGDDAFIQRRGKCALGLNVLLRLALLDIKLGNGSRKRLTPLEDLVALHILVGTELTDGTNALQKLTIAGGKLCRLFFIAAVLFDHTSVIGTKLVGKGVVCFQLCSLLFKGGILTGTHNIENALLIFKGGCVFLQLGDGLFQFSKLAGNGIHLAVQRFDLLFHGTDLARATENTAAVSDRTASKGTAHLDLLTVKGNDLDIIFQRLCHFGGVVDMIKDHGAPQK